MPMEIRYKDTDLEEPSLSFRVPSSSRYAADGFFNFGVDGNHSYGSPKKITAASDCHSHLTHDEKEEEFSTDGFEFAFTVYGPEPNPPITSYSDWNRPVYPVYPVFGRSIFAVDGTKEEPTGALKPLHMLLIEERREASPISTTASSPDSSEADELEGIPAATYCAWTPKASSAPASPASASPMRWKKSASTGSLLWWRLRDLIKRSHSDGKEKFVFLAVPEKKKSAIEKPNVKAEMKKAKDVKKAGKNVSKANKMDMVTAHRIFYSNAGQPTAGAPRRSFLPYRQDLIGLFANSRTFHPL